MANPKKPRQRTFTHRTRTGCLTCKTRRKKCDEEKPICRRCKIGGFVCDGYGSRDDTIVDGSNGITSNAKSSSLQSYATNPPGATVLASATTQVAIAPAKQRPMLLIPGDPLETQYYVWFFQNTIGDFKISRCLDREFFQKSFLGASQSAECIRHAVIALGATHWQFSRNDGRSSLASLSSSSSSTPSSSSSSSSSGFATPSPSLLTGPSSNTITQFALRHYNEAINSLIRLKQSATTTTSTTSKSNKNQPSTTTTTTAAAAAAADSTDPTTVLTCCFLFILLESLRGDFSEAFRHLESGMTILSTHTPSSGQHFPGHRSAVAELAAMFHAISSQVTIFSEDRIFPDVSRFRVPMKKYATRTSVLRDLDEAEDIMNTFGDYMDHIGWDLPQEWEDENSECNAKYEVVRGEMIIWRAQFEHLIGRMKQDGTHDANLSRIVNLRVQLKLWELFFQCQMLDDGKIVEPEITPDEANAILDQIDTLWYDPQQPKFGLKTDLLTAIYQVYVYCLDDGVRWRIIHMLRGQRRRQIVWDSMAMARFLEEDMAQRVLGTQKERWPEVGPSKKEGALFVLRPRRVDVE